MLKKITPMILCVPFIFGMLQGCTSNLGSSQYDVAQAGEAAKTYQGTIVEKRIVRVEGNQTTQVLSSLTGAAAGGLLGSTIGGGSGRTVATIGGAVVGGVAGNAVGRKLSEQEAYEYTVKLRNGSLRTVVQKDDLPVGSRVFVQISNQGRSRITYDTTGT